MKCKLLVGALTLLMVNLTALAADEGSTLYKKKCAHCHGASGEGKPAMKAPALKDSSLDATQMLGRLTKGEPSSKAPHNKGIAGLSDEQARAIAEYIKTMK